MNSECQNCTHFDSVIIARVFKWSGFKVSGFNYNILGMLPSRLRCLQKLAKSCTYSISSFKLAADKSERKILIPLEKRGFVIGKKGSTIFRIQRETGASLQVVDAFAAKDGFLPVHVKGTPEACDAATAAIERIIESTEHVGKEKKKGTMNKEVTILIPLAKKGFIIGKQGSAKSRIQQETGALLHILDDIAAKDGFLPVLIRGTSKACNAAKNAIEQIISSSEIATIMIPLAKSNKMIIGKGGSKSSRIEQETGASFNVDNASAKDGFAPVSIKGTTEACDAAIKSIEQLLSDEHDIEMLIPLPKIGLIIGSEGLMVNIIQQETGAYIYIDQTRVKEGFVVVTLIGSVEECKAARQAIELVVADREEIVIIIPQSKCCLIVGKAGAVRSRIERETGASLIIDDVFAKDGFVPVLIRGTSEECDEAKQAIEQCIANDKEIEMLIPHAKCVLIVGKEGSISSRIERETGAFFVIDDASAKDGFVPVLIRGTSEECNACKEVIEQLIAKNMEMSFSVPKEDCHLLVGREGSIVSRIQQDTGAYVHINLASPLAEHGLIPVVIKGTYEECHAARKNIEQRIADNKEILPLIPLKKQDQ